MWWKFLTAGHLVYLRLCPAAGHIGTAEIGSIAPFLSFFTFLEPYGLAGWFACGILTKYSTLWAIVLYFPPETLLHNWYKTVPIYFRFVFHFRFGFHFRFSFLLRGFFFVCVVSFFISVVSFCLRGFLFCLRGFFFYLHGNVFVCFFFLFAWFLFCLRGLLFCLRTFFFVCSVSLVGHRRKAVYMERN